MPSQLVRSDFPEMEDPTYSPADLSDVHALEYLLKFDHERYVITDEEALTLLDWLHLMHGEVMRVPMWTKAQAVRNLDPTKSAGLPWKNMDMHKKGDVISYLAEQLGFGVDLTDEQCSVIFDELHRVFLEKPSITLGTLKDELRKLVKRFSPREFFPIPVQAVCEGNWLCGAQNEAIMKQRMTSPVQIGLQVPGEEASMLWASLALFDPHHCGDFDASGFDGHFCLSFAAIICAFRLKYLPEEVWPFLIRYYREVYTGYASVCGVVFQLLGQRSGQTNTAIDNSLHTEMIVMLHAIRAGLSFQEFQQYIRFKCCGDDIVYSSKAKIFEPKALIATAASIGTLWETEHLEPVNILETNFMGMTPVVREDYETICLLYHFRSDRILASSLYRHEKATIADFVAKLTSLVILAYGDVQIFDRFREQVLGYVRSLLEQGLVEARFISSYLLLLEEPRRIMQIYHTYDTRAPRSTPVELWVEALLA